MGNKQEKVEVGEADKVEWDHDMMKDLVIKKDMKTDKQIMEATFAMNNKKDYEEWAKLLKKNPGQNSEMAFNPIKHSFHQKGACGSGGIAKIEYQSSPFMLLSEIFNRKNQHFKHFEQNELWYLLYSLTDLGKLFHDANAKVGDIRSSNVFMTNDGNVVVAHQYSWPGEKVNYQKSLHNKQNTYLAPQEVNDLEIGRPETISDFKKAESFSVGLTMLDAALLDNSRKIYGKKMQIDYESLKSMKQNLKNSSYSNLFKHVVLNLVEGDPKDRIRLGDLNNWLKPHERNIIDLDPFSIEGYPQQISQTAQNNQIRQRNLEFTYNQPQNQHIEYSFKNENRPQQNNFHTQNGENISIINRELAGVISGGVSQLDNKPQQNFVEDRVNFQARIEKEQNFSGDTPRFSRNSFDQRPVQANFILQQPNRGSRPHQIVFEQPLDSGANFQRLHSPQFRPNSMMRTQPALQFQRNQFSRPIQIQQQRVSQQPRPNFISPPPRPVQMSQPIQYNVPQARQPQPPFTVANRGINPPNSYFLPPQSPRQPARMEIIQREQPHQPFEQRAQSFQQVPSYSQPIITEQSYIPSYTNKVYQFDNKNSPSMKQPSHGLSNQNVNSSQFDPDQYFDPEKSENKKESSNLIETIEQRIRSSRENFPSYAN